MYYCINCAIATGKYKPAIPALLTHTQYQLEKYVKHTSPTSAYSFNTVFTSPSSYTYHHYIVTAVASGSVQVDTRGRINIVWVASEQTGLLFQGTTLVGPTEAVKVVFHDDRNRIHGFPISTSQLNITSCTACGRPVLS